MLDSVLDALVEGCNDRGAIVALDREHEGKTELLRIKTIELVQSGELFRGARCKPRTLLLPGGLRGQLTAYRSPARELGMRPDQCQLLIDARAIDSRTHRRMERESRVERTRVCNALGDPR